MGAEDLKALQVKVSSLRVEGKYKEVIEAGYQLLKAGYEEKDYKSVLVAYISIAASYYSIGDIEEAFCSIHKYEEVYSEHGDEYDELNLLNFTFLLHEYNKNFEKAKPVLDRSIQQSTKLKQYNMASNAYSNYSHIYMEEGQFEKALEMAERGIEMALQQKPEVPILLFRVKLNKAKAYIGLGEFNLSKAMIDEMMQSPLLDSYAREKAQCYDLQGYWYKKQKLYKEAFDKYTTAMEIVESYQDLYYLKTIQEERCQLCEWMNDIHTGYEVQKEYITLLQKINQKELANLAVKMEIKQSVTEIEKKANIDYLTGLYNRQYLESTANVWLEEAARKEESIVCLVFDIDNFKAYNDEYGHLFGDEVIKQVSAACASIIREGDLIGRYGGDEFVIVLKGVSLETGKQRAEQLEQFIQGFKLFKDGKWVSVTLSIGVGHNRNGQIKEFHELFESADNALYMAKEQGKNQIIVNQE